MTIVSNRRFMVLGDSLATSPYAVAPAVPTASKLWSTQLADATNFVVANLSAPGNRMTVGSAPDASVRYNSQALNLLRGVLKPEFCIITIGTNDWSGADTYITTNATGWNFLDDYQWVVKWCKANSIKPLLVPPLWRSDELNSVTHPDGVATLAQYRNWVLAIAQLLQVAWMQHTAFGLVPADFAPDGLHMLDSGHDKFFTGILSKINQLGWI